MWLGKAVNRIKQENAITALPLDVEQTITCFCRCYYIYTNDCNFIVKFYRKARRKEREGGESTASTDSKLYLESTVLERKLPEMDMRILVDLPAGLDYNEWLASHSKYTVLLTGCIVNYCDF